MPLVHPYSPISGTARETCKPAMAMPRDSLLRSNIATATGPNRILTEHPHFTHDKDALFAFTGSLASALDHNPRTRSNT